MASVPYLDDYLESLKNFLGKSQYNLNQIGDLDSNAQTLMKIIDENTNDYVTIVKGYSVDSKNETMTNIRQFGKAKEYRDDKVKLAIQTYKLVDNEIRKLDTQLVCFEAITQDNAVSPQAYIEHNSQKQGHKKNKHKETKKKNASNEEETNCRTIIKKRLNKGNAKKTNTAPRKIPPAKVVDNSTSTADCVDSDAQEAGFLTGTRVTHSSEVLDINVNPNEPTYCLCKQVSFGKMIGCDNPDCSIEWFHFVCVELVKKPKGQWFCPKCSIKRRKIKVNN